MASSFNTQGSQLGSAFQGLLGNSPSQQSQNTGMLTASAALPKTGTMQGPQGTSSLQIGATAPTQVPNQTAGANSANTYGGGFTSGILPQQQSPAPQPTTALKKDAAGNEYHKPESTPTPTPVAPTPPPPPPAIAGATSQNIDPSSAARSVYQASQPTALGTGAAQASALYGMLGNEAKLAPFAGGTTQGLDQSYANLTRPQSTGNLAGEEGLFNVQQGILQGAANTTAQQALAQQQLQTQGASNVLGAAQPTQVSPGNTLVQPLTGQPTYGLGAGTGQNPYQAFSNLQFNTQQGQALGKEASDLQVANNQIDQNFATLKGVTDKYGINLSSFPDLNSLQQFIQQKGGGAGGVAAFNEAYNALQTSIGQIINASGAFTPTEIGNLTSAMSAAKLSPSQMQELYDTVKQTAATKINTKLDQAKSYEQGGTSSVTGGMSGVSPSGSSTGGFAEAW